ncbi:MAG TPA: polymer-forming cytoskeletal protein [Candidatus Angelobacter sp.]|nr:polymer-forming cytoskeletal protein [Candidatus Angelobacter sp.]
MWKARPEDDRPTLNPSQPAQPAAAAPVSTPHKEALKPSTEARADVGHIGKSVVIRGELSGSEDLYLDGEIEGDINLRDHKLVIGPNGKIHATITARDIIVHGRVTGNIVSSERVELKRSCSLTGDVSTQRIVIEDGAFFKGAIDIKESKESKSDSRKPMAAAAAAGASSSASSATSSSSLSASPAAQGSFLDPK